MCVCVCVRRTGSLTGTLLIGKMDVRTYVEGHWPCARDFSRISSFNSIRLSFLYLLDFPPNFCTARVQMFSHPFDANL